jgi:hypothetical protein
MRVRLTTAWLRPILTLTGLAALLTLAACGGGNGAPNNPYQPVPPTPLALQVFPPSGSVYPGVPTTLTVSGGTAPYRAFSSNSAVLPVAQNVSGVTVVLAANEVSADTTLVVTVQDSAAQTAQSTLVVRPAPLFPNGLVVTPSNNICGASTLCSGSTGTASIQANGAAGAPVAGRPVRFDVVYGAFAIATTNPAQPLAQTATVVTDGTGKATVGIQTTVNATTQPAQIRATDVTAGQQVIANFTIVNSSDPAGSITVVPEKATITGPFVNVCPTGFQIDYFIYGGTPPYRVSSTFPQAVTLLNSTVNASGGSFSAVTNGTCVNPLTFTIVDAAGKQTTALLENLPGTATPPTTPAGPITVSVPAVPVCALATVQVLVSGGTAPYSISTSIAGITITPQPLAAPGYVGISGFNNVGSTQFAVSDASTPAQLTTFTIPCKP